MPTCLAVGDGEAVGKKLHRASRPTHRAWKARRCFCRRGESRRHEPEAYPGRWKRPISGGIPWKRRTRQSRIRALECDSGRLAAGAGCKGTKDHGINLVLNELHGAVAHQHVTSAGVLTPIVFIV